MVSPFDLTGQVALVVGGAGGLGRVAVDALTTHGATVEVADLDGSRTGSTSPTRRQWPPCSPP